MSPKAIEGEVITPDKPSTNGHGKQSSQIIDCFAGDETVQIWLDQVQWVRLKKELDYGEEQELQTALIKGWSTDQLRAAAAKGQTITHIDSGQFNLVRTALYIDDWNLLGRDGTTVRLPRKLDERLAVVKRISKEAGSILEAKINEIRGEVEPTEEAEPDENPLSLQRTGSSPE